MRRLTAQMVAVIRIKKAALDILNEMGVSDVDPLTDQERVYFSSKFGDAIAFVRGKLTMTQNQLAGELGISPATMGRVEKNSSRMKADIFDRLMQGIGARLPDEDKQLLLKTHQKQER